MQDARDTSFVEVEGDRKERRGVGLDDRVYLGTLRAVSRAPGIPIVRDMPPSLDGAGLRGITVRGGGLTLS